MKKIIVSMLMMSIVLMIFSGNASSLMQVKKPRRSEALYPGVLSYFFYDYSGDQVEKSIVPIDLSQMKDLDELIDYLKKAGLYFQPLKDFDSVCVAKQCFSNTQEFKSATEFIREEVGNNDAYLYVPLSMNPDDYLFEGESLYQSWSQEDHLKLFNDLLKEIGALDLEQDYSFFLDNEDEEDDSFIDYPPAFSPGYNEEDEYQ